MHWLEYNQIKIYTVVGWYIGFVYLYWWPLNLQKNVNMLDVINKATSISCYFILSMYFLDNIRTFSANIRFICTNFRNRGREKIVLLSSFFFLFWNESKTNRIYIHVRHVWNNVQFTHKRQKHWSLWLNFRIECLQPSLCSTRLSCSSTYTWLRLCIRLVDI